MRIFLAVVLLLNIASEAQAQRAVHLGIGGGAAIPVAKFGQDYRAGAAGQVTLITGSPDSFLGFRVDYGYNSFRARPEARDTLADTHFSSFTGDLLLTLPLGQLKPYAMVGAGWYPYREGRDKLTGNDFGVNGGAGVAFPFVVGGGFLEIRYHRVLKREIAERYVPVIFGIML